MLAGAGVHNYIIGHYCAIVLKFNELQQWLSAKILEMNIYDSISRFINSVKTFLTLGNWHNILICHKIVYSCKRLSRSFLFFLKKNYMFFLIQIHSERTVFVFYLKQIFDFLFYVFIFYHFMLHNCLSI